MFKKREGFNKKTIQDLTCWVPPPGKVFDHFTKKVIDVEIYSRSAVAKNQHWEIPPKPENYTSKRRKEKAAQKKDPSFFDPELEKFRRQEWARRMNGFWFMNNGKPVYVTGLHYFYMCYWRLDTGYPSFRHPDLLYFYFWQYCLEDPDCGGMLCIAQRRQGKTYRASASQYEIISRERNVIGGTQSKTGDDAKKFFIHHIVEPFKKLPDYFIPEYDKSQGTSPKNELRFFATSKRGENVEEEVDAINSLINYGPSNEKHYDGWKLRVGVIDEFGKADGINVVERHRTIKFCIMEGTRIVGKLIYTTTVEEMAGGKTLEESKKMWDESNPKERDGNGRTPTLLYRFFIPAYESFVLDKYGMPNVRKAKEKLNNMFDSYKEKGDYVGLASEMRKNPMSIQDVFRVSAKAPIFNIIILQDRLSQLAWRREKDLYIRGNLVWVNGERDTRVKFVESPNGRFLMRQLMQDASQNLHRPINKSKFVIGCDPFEHKSAIKPSDGASYCIKKFDPHDLEGSNSAVFEYAARPSPNVFFEDHIKACVYFGCQILIESNRIGMINYFLDRGYGDFLIWFEGTANPGIFAGEKSKQMAAEYIDDYVNNYSAKIWFPKLLEDLIMFDLTDSTKFDRAMAFGWALVAAGNFMTQQDIENPIPITDFVRTYTF